MNELTFLCARSFQTSRTRWSALSSKNISTAKGMSVMKTEPGICRKSSSFLFPDRWMAGTMFPDDDNIMHSETALIETLAISLAFAFIGGFIAARLRLPPLVGYLLAGIAV